MVKAKAKGKDKGNPSYIWVVVIEICGQAIMLVVGIVCAVDAVYAPNRPRQSPVLAVWCCGWRGSGIGIGSGMGKGNGIGIGIGRWWCRTAVAYSGQAGWRRWLAGQEKEMGTGKKGWAGLAGGSEVAGMTARLALKSQKLLFCPQGQKLGFEVRQRKSDRPTE